MEVAWTDDTPHGRFWRRLLNENVDQLLSDPDATLLKQMRFNNTMLKNYQRRFGPVLRERGLCLYKLIGSAYGENWDSEDDEKQRHRENIVPMSINNDAVCLDSARQAGLCEGKSERDVLQASNGCGEKFLQEEGSSSRPGSPQKETPS